MQIRLPIMIRSFLAKVAVICRTWHQGWFTYVHAAVKKSPASYKDFLVMQSAC